MVRSSTALAVLSALCAVLALLIPQPSVLLARLASVSSAFWRRGAPSSLSSASHPFASAGGPGSPSSCPLGFGGSGDAGGSGLLTPPRVPPIERRIWYVGAGGGWTGAVEADGEGPLWIERGGGFAVDGAGDVAEVAATERQAAAAAARDERAGLLAAPPRQLRGAFVLPGFVDPHVHLIPAGLALTTHADLREAASRVEWEAGVAAAARRLVQQHRQGEDGSGPAGCSDADDAMDLPWLMGGWWDESRWAGDDGGGIPTAAWIDAALERAALEEEEEAEEDADKARAACLRALPVLLSRMDSHMAVANRAALRRALLREQGKTGDGASTAASAAAEAARELLASAEAILGGGDAAGSSGRFIDAASGLVREAGLLAVARAAPPPSLPARRAALAAAAARLLSAGVTAVGDMGRAPFAGGDPAASWDDLEELYDPAAAAAAAESAMMAAGGAVGGGAGGGQPTPPPLLPLRVAAYLPLETWPRLAARVAARGSVMGPLHAAGVKTFWDGSLGSRTALMTGPYSDDDEAEEGGKEQKGPPNRGVRMVASPEGAARDMAGADAAGLQPAVHAIGDAAVDEATAALEGVAKARESGGSGGGGGGGTHRPPLRLEHAQHLSGENAARRLGALAGWGSSAAVAVINPQHLISDAKLMRFLPPAMRAAGHERTHAWRALQRAGVPLAIGSDWPIVDLDPWAELWAAVHRRPVGEASGDGGGGNDGAAAPGGLSPEEALRASTSGAAYAAGLDAWCGRLVPGMKADFVLLDASPFAAGKGRKGGGSKGRALRLASARPRVLSTFVGGICRHGCGDNGRG